MRVRAIIALPLISLLLSGCIDAIVNGIVDRIKDERNAGDDAVFGAGDTEFDDALARVKNLEGEKTTNVSSVLGKTVGIKPNGNIRLPTLTEGQVTSVFLKAIEFRDGSLVYVDKNTVDNIFPVYAASVQTENTIVVFFAGDLPIETGYGIVSALETTHDPSILPATFTGTYSEISNNGRTIKNGEASFSYDANAGTLNVSGPSSLNGRTFHWDGEINKFLLSTKNVSGGARLLGDSELAGTYVNTNKLLSGVFGADF